MSSPVIRSLVVVAVAAGVLAAAPPASATPSCVAQSVRSEQESSGTAWGHDLVAFLASNPDVLEQFGFRSFGELVRFAASEDPEACPPDL